MIQQPVNTPNSHTRPTTATIDLEALAVNFRKSREFMGRDLKYMAIVKADAYGHGAVDCSRRLETEGVDWFGVAMPEEGIELRRAGISRPILCLGSFWPGQEELILENGLTPVIFSEDPARRLNEFARGRGRITDIHVKLDTGMGRLGVRPEAVPDLIHLLRGLKNLRVSGLMTHFASAENPAEDDFTEHQITTFEQLCDGFIESGFKPEIIHLANSPGAVRHRRSQSGMVRLGGALWGLLDDILKDAPERPELTPVMSLTSRISDIKRVPKGETLGYGRTFTTNRDSLIASVPVGYADGYPRSLSNKGKVSIRGRKAPVVGRVSMDWTLIDVTDVTDAAVNDEVFLIGGYGTSAIKATDLAGLIGTIGYEITTRISSRVPRMYK